MQWMVCDHTDSTNYGPFATAEEAGKWVDETVSEQREGEGGLVADMVICQIHLPLGK